MEEVPLLAQLQSKYSQTATILGISIDTSLELVDRTIKQKKMTWPVIADKRGFDAPLAIAYHVQGTPDIFVLDTEGRIFKRLETATEIEPALQALAAEKIRTERGRSKKKKAGGDFSRPASHKPNLQPPTPRIPEPRDPSSLGCWQLGVGS